MLKGDTTPMADFPDIIRAFERARHQPFALATLVKVIGSSYRRPGARMLVAQDGTAAGSLSGGCIESEIAAKGVEVIRAGRPTWMEFDTRRRFGCHGSIEILIEPAGPEFLAGMAARLQARTSTTIATIFSRDAADAGTRIVGEMESPPEEALVRQVDPPIQLLMIGGGPDSAALENFSQALGWQLVPMESAAELRCPYDPWTAAIVKTHNYGRDFAALRALLPSALRYVGLIGPRNRRERLLGDLLDIGVEAGANFFSPAGLDLGGDSPEAIALAIIAEIQALFEGGTGQPLRHRRAPIHAPPEPPIAVAG